MHRITISVLSVFIVLPAFASARLPVVNVASGGVSARAAFGMENAAAVTVAPAVPEMKKATQVVRTTEPAVAVAPPVAVEAPSDVKRMTLSLRKTAAPAVEVAAAIPAVEAPVEAPAENGEN